MGKKNSVSAMSDESDWRAEDDMRALARAEEIRRDPKRLAAARECADKKLKEYAAVSATTAVPN